MSIKRHRKKFAYPERHHYNTIAPYFQKYCAKCGQWRDLTEFHSFQRSPVAGWEPRYTCKRCIDIRSQAYNRKTKLEVMTHYGQGVAQCACCGEDQIEFLTIDHIHSNGGAHRRELGTRGGNQFYLWLRREGFPEGYQVLCFNCNCAKGAYGECPHERIRREQALLSAA